jgi:hypothetical protein
VMYGGYGGDVEVMGGGGCVGPMCIPYFYV